MAHPIKENAPSILVLSLGNPILSDDAIGFWVMDEVRAAFTQNGDSSNIIFKKLCAGGFDILDQIEGHNAVIMIDSYAPRNAVPGKVRLFTEDRISKIQKSAHVLNLPAALEVCRSCGLESPRFFSAVVIEVDSDNLGFGETLSNDVLASITEASRLVTEQIQHFERKFRPENIA